MNAAQFLPPGANYSNRERLLPSQPAMRQFFKGNDAAFPECLEGVTNSVLPIESVHEKFDIKLAPGMAYETLGSDLSTLHFLQLLVRLTNAKHVLEIGTYIGVSTMFLAEAVGDDGVIYTVEKGKEFSKIARENFARNNLDQRIRCHIGTAQPFVSTQCGVGYFDMTFLDGAKDAYGVMLPQLLATLRPGGLLVIDDVFCNGDTLNFEPATGKGRGVRDLLRQVAALKDHAPVILPYGNGLLLLRKPTP